MERRRGKGSESERVVVWNIDRAYFSGYFHIFAEQSKVKRGRIAIVCVKYDENSDNR